MDIEWFRDLSITILGLVTTVVLIFVAVIIYRLYGVAKSTLLSVKAASKSVSDIVTLVQEGIKPLITILALIQGIKPPITILALIQGIRAGFESISKVFKKENSEGENIGE